MDSVSWTSRLHAKRRRRSAIPTAGGGIPAMRAGSIGPKVAAACRFASATGKPATIGALGDLGKIIAGEAGTTVSPRGSGIVYAA